MTDAALRGSFVKETRFPSGARAVCRQASISVGPTLTQVYDYRQGMRPRRCDTVNYSIGVSMRAKLLQDLGSCAYSVHIVEGERAPVDSIHLWRFFRLAAALVVGGIWARKSYPRRRLVSGPTCW